MVRFAVYGDDFLIDPLVEDPIVMVIDILKCRNGNPPGDLTAEVPVPQVFQIGYELGPFAIRVKRNLPGF